MRGSRDIMQIWHGINYPSLRRRSRPELSYVVTRNKTLLRYRNYMVPYDPLMWLYLQMPIASLVIQSLPAISPTPSIVVITGFKLKFNSPVHLCQLCAAGTTDLSLSNLHLCTSVWYSSNWIDPTSLSLGWAAPHLCSLSTGASEALRLEILVNLF